jgi:hypothetical protein
MFRVKARKSDSRRRMNGPIVACAAAGATASRYFEASDTDQRKDRAMEHPYALNEIRRKPRDRKKLAAETIRRATRQAPRFAPLPPLPTIPDVELLTPGSPKYDECLPASNLRTTVRPALRALCKTEQSVAAILHWGAQRTAVCATLRRPFVRGIFPERQRRHRHP